MPTRDEIWYAAQSTKVVFAPPKLLETFGETSVRYYVLTELMDSVEQLRIRQGRVTAERPRVITPKYFVNQALTNFGEEARQYLEQLLSSSDGTRIIQYGLQFRKEEYHEEVVQGNINEVADQISRDAQDRVDDVCGVILGVDDLWEVSLLSFVNDLIRRSAPRNAREMAGQGLLDASSGNVPNAVRIEIESDFRAAAGRRDRVQSLGEKLRSYGLFAEYEDRFYELYRRAR